MAEKKEVGEKPALDKGEKRDRLFTNLSVSAIGLYILNEVFDWLRKRGVEHVTKKVETKLGLGTEEARESFVDESVYLEDVLTEELGEEDARKALNFEEDLRKEDPLLAEAYVLALAKLRRQFKEDGQKPGDASVVKLIQLLIQLGTFEERVAFVKGRGIEALISSPKPDYFDKAVKFVKENQTANLDDLGKSLKGFRERAKEARRARDERDKASRKA